MRISQQSIINSKETVEHPLQIKPLIYGRDRLASGTKAILKQLALRLHAATGTKQLRCWQNASVNASWNRIRGGVNVLKGRIFRASAVALTAALAAVPARAQETLGDPAGSGVLVSAVQWLQGTLLGTVATVVAVIAVAAVGFMMLTGRINWRYGATVILGCFILFGAASIVAGIQSTASLGN